MKYRTRQALAFMLCGLLTSPFAAPAFGQVQNSSGAVVPGSVDNEVHINISNASQAPLVGLRAVATELPPGITNLRIEPAVIDRIEHDRSAEFTILFDVAPGVAEGEIGPIRFEVTVAEGELGTTNAELDLTIAPAPEMSVCVIQEGAPEDFPPEDAFGYCDVGREPTEYDRVAVFVTPPYAITEPFEESDPFMFEVRGPRGDRMGGGTFAPKAANSATFAKNGSPGRFAVVFDLWNRNDSPDPDRARRGPGTYTVRSVAADYSGSSTFGQGDTTVVIANAGTDEDGNATRAEWEELETFEVESMRLHFQGFVMETVNDIWIPDREDIWEGKLTVLRPDVAGSTVTLGAEAWIRKAHIDGAGRRPEEEVHRTSTRVTIEFPEELAPGHEEMGVIHTLIQPGEQSQEYFLTAGMHLLIPTDQLPPDRHLVERGATPAPWANEGALPEDYCNFFATGDERFTFGDYTGDGGVWVWQRTPLPVGCDKKESAELDVRTTLLSGDKETLAGDPGLPLLAHLHDPDTKWVIPVFIDLTDDREIRGYGRSLEMKTFGYAVYAAEPGTYDGPAPTGSPPVGDGPDNPPTGDPPGDPPGVDPPPGDPPTGDPPGGPPGGDPPPGNPPGGPPGGGPPGGDPPPGDPPTGNPPGGPPGNDPPGGAPPGPIVPSDPDVAALIRQWISLAEPPKNATEGASLRYDHRGVAVGSTLTGEITHGEAANLPFDPTFLWTNHRGNDSVDHCTMEEYVEANVAGESIDHCVGRYARTVAVPRVQGMPIADAMSELQRQGLEPAPQLIGAAPSPDLSGTVAEQRPASTFRLAPGSPVELDVYSDYVEPGVPVPDVVGLPVADAVAALQNAGLEVQPSLIGAAPTPGQSGMVVGQRPTAADLVAPDSPVEIDVYSDYVAPGTTVPDVRGMTLADAQRELANAGLRIDPTLLGAAPDASQASRVDSQRPLPGETVAPETPVEIDVWGDYVPPPPDPIEDDTIVTPNTTILTGRPPIECPATNLFGGPLEPSQYRTIGYAAQANYGWFRCEWQNPGAYFPTLIELTWYTAPGEGERFCGAEDTITDLSSPAYHQMGRVYSGSRRVQAEFTWQDPSEQDWIFNLARSFIAAVEPYTQPCTSGTTEGILQGAPDPRAVCPSSVGGGTFDPGSSGLRSQYGYYSIFDCSYRWPDGSTGWVWRVHWAHRDVAEGRAYCTGLPDIQGGATVLSTVHTGPNAVQVAATWRPEWGRDFIMRGVRSVGEAFQPYAAPCRRDPP